MDDLSWSNKLQIVQAEKNLWQKIAIGCFLSIPVLVIVLAFMSYHYFSKVNMQRLLLVAPTLGVGPVEVEADATITDSITKVVAKRIVELNENWTYESLEDNFRELFTYYYDQKMVELTKANLLSSDRISYVKQNKVISIFSIDWQRSKVGWCALLKRSCSLIVGKRKIFINNNEPYKESEIAYLIFAEAIFPTSENPHAIRVKRLKVDDFSLSPYGNLLNQYESALKGVLPNENG